VTVDSIKPAIKGNKEIPEQFCAVVPKVWGREEWIVNNEKYCGKKLIFNQGFRLSLHYHKVKEESFFVLSGTIYVELIDGDVRVDRILIPGDIVHVKPYVQHRITALTDAEVMEFSTHHMDEDSYRIEVGGPVDLSACSLAL
jgi:quercetin dioxygenase-like cupin family protein